MFEKYFANIEKNLDIRQTLIALRSDIKNSENLKILKKTSSDKIGLIKELLTHEDAKVRKNAALILGEIEEQHAIGELFEAYKNEAQLFVRSSYLTAISKLDYRAYLDAFKERADVLTKTEMTAENQKHLSEELKLLRDMILTMEGTKKHTFRGYAETSDMVLVTSPGFEQLTFDQLPERVKEDAKIVNGGVLVRTNRLPDILDIRTIKGILFRFCKNPLPSTDFEAVAGYIVDAHLVDYIAARHSGKAPYYFRIDMKTKLVLDEKGQFIKRLASKIEQLTDYELQNSASNYEFEIRILENKKGQYSVYLKLDAIPDNRFAYRRNAVSTSLNPVKAAEIVALSKEYLTKNAIVLDPFCGTGTLLIERHKMLKTRSMYGTDIYGEAIILGRENASLAGCTINFINRDFADFKHEYLFDELITEMPAKTDRMTDRDMYELYMMFIRRINEWMRPGAYIIICTTEENRLKRLVASTEYLHTEAVYHLSGKRENALVILKYK